MEKNRYDIVSTGQQRAQSISIQVSSREKCNAGCQACISRTTPGTTLRDIENLRLCEEKRLRVGLGYARHLGATHAIMTGKADPTQEDADYLAALVKTAREYIPLVDMHTNGFLLQLKKAKRNLLPVLVDAGLTMITFSISSFDPDVNFRFMKIRQRPAELIRAARDLGLLVRCSLLVHKEGVEDLNDIMNYIKVAGDLGVQMVVIREVWVPDAYGRCNKKVYDWNLKNKIPVGQFESKFRRIAQSTNQYGLQERDPLPWGTPVFVVGGIFNDPEHGVNVTFARCDEANSGPVMKSVVHKPNGHGYRNWDHNGDILY